MEELLDIFDEEENFLGSKTRSECHMPDVDFYHRVVWIWLINNKNEILIQQRSLNKKYRAGCWDEISVAGHISKDESPINACKREIKEELGIDVENLNYVDKWLHKQSKEIVYFYVATITQNVNDFVLQTKEVSDAKFIDFEQLKKDLNNNYFGEYPQEYKNLVIKILTNALNK